jgi:uncharacterized protein
VPVIQILPAESNTGSSPDLEHGLPTLRNNEERRTRSVLDPIHGLIRLTSTEMKVVDHPLFQRLRRIKQNGLLYFVFPGATHSRFEHSVGALYVAHGMLNSLVLNSIVGLSKGNVKHLPEALDGHAVELPELGSAERIFIYRVTRLAALAHDLGHGPLSHTFDSFAPTRTALEVVLADPDLHAILPLRDFLLKWGTDPRKTASHIKNRRVPHEVMSCVFFTKIWHDLEGDTETPSAVCAAILGHQDGESAATLLSSATARAWVPLIHDVVASAPADADRMDYMERDSRAIGVTYGLFDRNRVLKSLLCYKQDSGSNPHYRLGVKRSGLPAIENLMQARYELFAQIYYHKTNRAISLMLERISDLADEQMDLFRDPPKLDRWIEIYLDLSDEYFFRMLRGKDGSLATATATVKELASDIQERRLWKRILEPTTETDAAEILSTLHDEFGAYVPNIRKDETKPKALKDLTGGAALLIRNNDGTYVAGSIGRWTQESTIINALEEADKKFVRIYFTDTDDVLAGRIRERALQLVFARRERVNATS